ncbi:putative death-receptor fusion protein-domain-containing protein [Gorgonomyces haynaldii]|nr:putative death-receptor fusion protein-domain-containing protein [Gorgonomyces haynaldii]
MHRQCPSYLSRSNSLLFPTTPSIALTTKPVKSPLRVSTTLLCKPFISRDFSAWREVHSLTERLQLQLMLKQLQRWVKSGNADLDQVICWFKEDHGFEIDELCSYLLALQSVDTRLALDSKNSELALNSVGSELKPQMMLLGRMRANKLNDRERREALELQFKTMTQPETLESSIFVLQQWFLKPQIEHLDKQSMMDLLLLMTNNWETNNQVFKHKLQDLLKSIVQLLNLLDFKQDLLQILFAMDNQRLCKYEMLSFVSKQVEIDQSIIQESLWMLKSRTLVNPVCSFLVSCSKDSKIRQYDNNVDILVELLSSGQDYTVNCILERLLPQISKKEPIIERLFDRLQDPLSIAGVLRVQKQHQPLTDKQMHYVIQHLTVSDPNVQMLLLTVMTESKGLEHDLSQKELDGVKRFLLSRSSWNAAQRNKLSAVFAFFFERIKGLLYLNIKQQKQDKIQEKLDFLKWIHDFCLISLFPGSNYQRTAFALQLLTVLKKAETQEFKQKRLFDIQDKVPEYIQQHSDLDIQLLVNVAITDTHPANTLLVEAQLKESHLDLDEAFLNQALKKVESMRASDTFSSIQMLSMLQKCSPSITTLLLDHLEQGVKLAEQDIVACSVDKPLNGYLGCLVKMSDALNDQESKKAFDLAVRSCKCVLDICSDDSPEGQLPASFEGIYNNIMQRAQLQHKHLAQLVLRHCFRTVKEATDLLVNLVKRDPAFEPVLVDLMPILISSIRHRGAFSAVHSNFTRLCALVKPQVLEQWLHLFLDAITKQVSVTRRSAGLPLAVLSIVNEQDQLLKPVLTGLYDILDKEIPQDLDQQKDLGQVHCLNILMNLVQDSKLSQKMRPHLQEIFTRCIHHLHSVHFPIRNCAAMLFSSLLDKYFYKTGRNIVDSTQLVTFGEFFTRFPQLFDLLVSELQQINMTQVSPVLYPILTLLSRLRPNPLDKSDYSIFSRLVLDCVGAKQFKVRESCAKTLSSILLDPMELVKRLDRHLDLNTLHGLSLSLKYYLERYTVQIPVQQILDLFDKRTVISLSILLQPLYKLDPSLDYTKACLLVLETENKSVPLPDQVYVDACSILLESMDYEQIPASQEHLGPAMAKRSQTVFNPQLLSQWLVGSEETIHAALVSLQNAPQPEHFHSVVQILGSKHTYHVHYQAIRSLSSYVSQEPIHLPLLRELVKSCEQDCPIQKRIETAELLVTCGPSYLNNTDTQSQFAILLDKMAQDDEEDVRSIVSRYLTQYLNQVLSLTLATDTTSRTYPIHQTIPITNHPRLPVSLSDG